MNGVTKSQVLLVAAHVGRLALGIAITSVLGRLLAPADFGFYALVTGVMQTAMVLLDMGTNAAVTRTIAAAPATEVDTVETLLSLRRLIATALLAVVIAVAVSGYLAHGKHRLVLVAVAVGVYVLYLHGYSVVYQVRQSYEQAIAFGLGGQVAFLAASVALLKLNVGGGTVALLVVAREIANAVASRWIALRMLRSRVRVAWRRPGTWALLKAGWMIGVAGVCYKLATYAGGFFLWGLASPEAMASFSAAQRPLIPLGDMAWLFVTPLLAAMSAGAGRDDGQLRTQVQAFARLLAGAAALIAVAAWFLAPMLLRLLYGEQYAAGPWSAVGVFRWLALGYLFALVTPVLAVGELVRGAAQPLIRISLASLALNTALNLAWVPAQGAEGAAMALCASETFVFVVLFGRCLARGDLGLGPAWIGYLLPAGLLAAALAGLAGSPVLQLVLAAAWGPVALLALQALPEQRACRASLARAAPQRPARAEGVPSVVGAGSAP